MFKGHIPIHVSLGQQCFKALVSAHQSRDCVPGISLFVLAAVPAHALSFGNPVPSVVCCCSNAHGSLLLAVVSGFWVSLPPPSPPFLLLHLRRTSSGQLAVCTLRWSRWLAWSRAVWWSLGAVGSGRFGALAQGAMSPSLRAILARRSSGWAWGLMDGLSGLASHQCGLHLGAGCQ